MNERLEHLVWATVLLAIAFREFMAWTRAVEAEDRRRVDAVATQPVERPEAPREPA